MRQRAPSGACWSPYAGWRLAGRWHDHAYLDHAPGFPLLKPLSDDELRKVSVPVALLIAAESEPFDPNELAARAEALLPQVSIERLPGAGHALIVSHVEICAARIALTHT